MKITNSLISTKQNIISKWREKVFLSLFLVNLIVGFFIFTPNSVLGQEVSCCIVKTQYYAKKEWYTYTNRSSLYNVTSPFCKITTKEDCLNQENYRGSGVADSYIVPSCTGYCYTKEELFSKVLFRENCCVPNKSGFSCIPISSNTTACSNGVGKDSVAYKFEPVSCVNIDECNTKEVLPPDKLKEATKKTQFDSAKYVENEILKNQVVPKLSVGIPGFTKFDNIQLSAPDSTGRRFITIPWIAQYIKVFYEFAIGIAGVIATVMLMVGGLMFIMSGGDSGKVSEAKEYIKASVLGLVLIMSSYFILHYINPALTTPYSLQLELPELKVNDDRDITLEKECDFGYINKDKKTQLLKTPGGTYCPSYSKLVAPYDKLDNKLISGAQNMKYSEDVIKGLEIVQKELKTANLKIEIQPRTQTLEAQQEICQKSLIGRKTQDKNLKVNPNAVPDCTSNKHLNGRELIIQFNDIDRGCGGYKEFTEDNDCRKVTNTPEQIKKKIDDNKCIVAHTGCQDKITDIMTKSGFKHDPKFWFIFTK